MIRLLTLLCVFFSAQQIVLSFATQWSDQVTFSDPLEAELASARMHQAARRARQQGPRNIFAEHFAATVEYAVVRCDECSPEAAAYVGGTCFVVYDHDHKDKLQALRQHVFTKDMSTHHMTRAKRDESSGCFVGSSAHVFGREAIHINMDGRHVPVFVPLVRKPSSNFLSSTWIGRRLFRMAPPAQPLTPEEEQLETSKTMEIGHVLAPGPFLHFMRHSGMVSLLFGSRRCGMLLMQAIQVSKSDRDVYMRANATETFELIATGAHSSTYALEPRITYIPVSELALALEDEFPFGVPTEGLYTKLATQKALVKQLYLSQHDGLASVRKAITVGHLALNATAGARLVLLEKQHFIAAYLREPSSPLRDQCIALYILLQDMLLSALNESARENVKMIKHLLLADPVVLAILPFATVEHYVSQAPSSAFWDTICAPMDRLACRLLVTEYHSHQEKTRMYMRQLQLYYQALRAALRVADISDPKHFRPDHQYVQAVRFALDDARRGRATTVTTAYVSSAQSMILVRSFEQTLLIALKRLSLPQGSSEEEKNWFATWQTNVSSHATTRRLAELAEKRRREEEAS